MKNLEKFPNEFFKIFCCNDFSSVLTKYENSISLRCNFKKLKDKKILGIVFNSLEIKKSGKNYNFEKVVIFEDDSFIFCQNIYLFLYGKIKLKKEKHIVFLVDKKIFLISTKFYEKFRNQFQTLLLQPLKDSISEITNFFKEDLEIVFERKNNFGKYFSEFDREKYFLDKNENYLFNKGNLEKIILEFDKNEEKKRLIFSSKTENRKIKVDENIGFEKIVLLQNKLKIEYILGKKYFTVTSNYTNYRGQDFVFQNQDLTSTGQGGTLKEAKLKSFVEAIERYVSGYTNFDILNSKKFEEKFLKDKEKLEKISGIKIEAKDFEKSLFFEGFELNSFKNIPKNKKIYIPGEFIFYPYPKNNRKINFFANSSGIASYNYYFGALERALYELVERDAIMKTWLLKLSPEKIEISSIPEKLKKIFNYIEEKFEDKIYILDISFDSPFKVYLGVGRNYKTGRIFLGAGCNINSEIALERTINELFTSLKNSTNTENKELFEEDIFSPSEHRYFHEQEKYLYSIDFLFKNKNYKKFEKSNFKIDDLVKFYLERTGDNLYCFDLTTKYTEKMGIYTARIFSEKLISIWFSGKNGVPIYLKNLDLKKYEKYKIIDYDINIPDFLHFFD